MILIGLTGSIGTGKSTTAKMFGEFGDAVIDADKMVHDLYRGDAVAPVEAAFPGVTLNGEIDRAALSARVLGDGEALKKLEEIVHPLVREREAAHLEEARRSGRRIAVLDVPLLFETGRNSEVAAVVVTTVPEDVQRRRVLSRPGMTEDALAKILSRQMSDHEKRMRAHFVVETHHGMEHARQRVGAIRRAVFTLGDC